MSDGDLLQAYDDAVGDSDDHLAGLRAVERAARAAEREDCAAEKKGKQAMTTPTPRLSDDDTAELRGLAEQALDRYARPPSIGPYYGDRIARALDEIALLRRELDSACEAQRAAETELAQQMARAAMHEADLRRKHGKAILDVSMTLTAQRKAEDERDAAMALLTECREQFEIGDPAWCEESPLYARLVALLGDGGE